MAAFRFLEGKEERVAQREGGRTEQEGGDNDKLDDEDDIEGSGGISEVKPERDSLK
jgi:hypothetical protein